MDFVSCRRRRCRNLRHVLFRHSLVRLHEHNSATVPPELLSDSPHQIPVKSIQPLKQSVPANFLREHMAIELHSRLNNQIRLILAHLKLVVSSSWLWSGFPRPRTLESRLATESRITDRNSCDKGVDLALLFPTHALVSDSCFSRGRSWSNSGTPVKDHCHLGITFSHME